MAQDNSTRVSKSVHEPPPVVPVTAEAPASAPVTLRSDATLVRPSADAALGDVSANGVPQFYAALQASAQAALAGTLNAPITPIQAGSQGDFPYVYQNANLAFNLNTYNFLSGVVSPGSYPGAAQIGSAGSFTNGYGSLLTQIFYQLSAADNAILTSAQLAAAVQQTNTVQTYTGIFGPITQAQLNTAATVLGYTPQNFDYVVGYALGSQWSGATPPLSYTTMQNSRNLQALLPRMPPSGGPVVIAVQQYLVALGGAANAIQSRFNAGTWLINQLQSAIQSPTLGVNAMQTVDPNGNPAPIVSQYGISKSGQQILNDLAGSSSISMSMSIRSSSSSNYNVSINGGTSFSIGGPILTLSGGSSAQFNMESIQGAGKAMSISIKYTGYSVVPSAPQAQQTVGGGGVIGWYSQQILQEAYSNFKSGFTGSGMMFHGTPSITLDRYPSGNFNLLSNVIISNYPTISINYTEGNFTQFSQSFASQTSGSVKLFGFIPVGGGSMSTYQASTQQTGSSSNFSVNFVPPTTAGVPPLSQTAYVVGGVVVSPAVTALSVVDAFLSFAAV
jgi:hypothetical protein